MRASNFILNGWFRRPGAYVLVDGQFGSTGKGLVAGFLAEWAHEQGAIPTVVTTNAGPNSGHTAYLPNGDKVMTQQVPVMSAFLAARDKHPITYINAGAIVDSDILFAELQNYGLRQIAINPAAAIITQEDREIDQGVVARVAGTGKGIGPAIARKVMRQGQIARDVYGHMLPAEVPEGHGWDNFWDWTNDVVFVETAQGFSLGVNSARFWPHTTSRECTVMQAISDARIPASRVQKTIAVFRTFPIRVGNTPTGFSGDCYPDQREMTWDEVGQPAEMTTVTKRVRRVFSWSRIQFRECIAANEPDVVFLNFANYLDDDELPSFIEQMEQDYYAVLGRKPDHIFLGFGPYTADIRQLY